MATQPVVDLGSTSFLDRMPRESRDQILVNSTRIRYQAGTIPFRPADRNRADILEKGFARIYLTSSEGRQTTIRYVHAGELMGGLLVYSHCIRTIALHAFGSVVQPVAYDLLDRTSRTQLTAGHLEAAVSQQEIADGIGSARPVVAKGLTTIRARRLVDTAHRRVRIIDPAGLEALALTGLP